MVQSVRLFSLPNQFIVTLLMCNIDEYLSVQYFHIKSNLEKGWWKAYTLILLPNKT